MNITAIFDIARRTTGEQGSARFTDALLLPYANIVYHELENILAPLGTGLFESEWAINLVSGTSVYSIPKTTSTASVTGVKKILAVECFLNDERVRIDERKVDNLQFADSFTSTTIFYEIKGNSIKLYNTNHETVTNGLKIIGIADLLELTTSSVEADIKIPYQYQYVMSLGVAYYIFIEQRRIDEANSHYQFYNMKREEMRLGVIKNRRNTSFQDLAPTTLNYY